MKKQKELYKQVKNGVCFPTAIYNVFPAIFKDNKDLLSILSYFDENNLNIAESIKYINIYLMSRKDLVGEYLDFTFFEINKNSNYYDFEKYLEENKNNILILCIDPFGYPLNGHTVNILEYDNSIIFFENGNDQTLLMNITEGFIKRLLKKENLSILNIDKKLCNYITSRELSIKDIKNFLIDNNYIKNTEKVSYIDPKLLYLGCDSITFIYLGKKDSVLYNYSSRLKALSLPNVSFHGKKINDYNNEIITISKEDIK